MTIKFLTFVSVYLCLQRYFNQRHKAKCLLVLVFVKMLIVCVVVIIYDNAFTMVKK